MDTEREVRLNNPMKNSVKTGQANKQGSNVAAKFILMNPKLIL